MIEPMILVEIEGGTWSQGRHSRGYGMAKDAEKYNRATILGYRILRYTTDMVMSGHAEREVYDFISPFRT
ncbi:MAG TPA: hypothetical protein VGK96_28335 [Candidatus Sulfotelmatobacter sp.]|jgi:hypothetical protein